MDYSELFKLKSRIDKAEFITDKIQECSFTLQYTCGDNNSLNEKAYNKVCDILHLEIKPLLQQYLKELQKQFEEL